MSRICTVCGHEDRARIDTALLVGTPFRHIAAQFHASTAALQRHKQEHIPPAMAKAQEAKEEARGDDLLKEARALRAKAYGLLLAAEREGDYRTALAGVREARGCLELLAKLLGQLDERPVVNVTLSAEWVTVRGALLSALTPYPDARTAVAARLGALEAHNGHHTP